MNYIFYILLGFAPSIIWLSFYLKKDKRPEPKQMVLKIFFWGMLITLPVFFIELGLTSELNNLLPSIFNKILCWFVGVALIEETMKFLVVKYKVLKNQEFDEPVDAMIYMIIVALGFASLENILVLFSNENFLFLENVIIILFVRFIGATFLHALSSGVLGYFLALSIYETKKRLSLLFKGLISATLLHGLFNIIIIEIGESFLNQHFLTFIFLSGLIVVILSGVSFFVGFGFRKIKTFKSVCKTN